MKQFKSIAFIIPYTKNKFYNRPDLPLPGLGYLEEVAKLMDIDYNVYDTRFKKIRRNLFNYLKDQGADLIAIHIKSFGYKLVYKLCEKIKRTYPYIKIIAGGPHISVFRDRVLKECPAIDYAVIREGELPFKKILEGEPLNQIENLIYRINEKIVLNKASYFEKNLDNLVWPKYDKYDMYSYSDNPCIYIVGSRGCPNNCNFCSVNLSMGKRYRTRSPESIIEEIKYFYNKRGIKIFNFIDDHFLVKKKRVYKLCELILENNIKAYLKTTGIYAKAIDEEVLKAMKKAGFRQIIIGVKSANNHVLKEMGKGETIEVIQNAITIATKLNFEIFTGFMIGQINETEEDVKRSFKFALKNKIQNADFYNIIPYPGTELYKSCVKNNWLLVKPEIYLNRVTTRIGKPLFETPMLSKKQRKKLFKQGEKVHNLIYRRNKSVHFRNKLNNLFQNRNIITRLIIKIIIYIYSNEYFNRSIRIKFLKFEDWILRKLKKK